MIRLTSQSATAGATPIEIGTTRLIERVLPLALLIAPFDEAACQSALALLGLSLPAPSTRSFGPASEEILFYGMGSYLYLSPAESGPAPTRTDAPSAPEAAPPKTSTKSAASGPVTGLQLIESLSPFAAISDISDGLCHLLLDGPLARAALARLVPLDLRPDSFGPHAAVLTLLGKQKISLRRAGPEGFEIITARSLAKSAAEDIRAALTLAAAR